jgi:hypothetical protein
MNIELADASQTLLKISWNPYDAALEVEIVNRLNTIPGATGYGRCWYAPVIQCERCMQLFGRASFAYEALQAADKAARNFYDSLIGTGVELAIDSDKVKATTGNVSPLLAQLVDERSPALVSFVELELQRASLKPQPLGPLQGPMTAEDAKLEPLVKGIVNAQKRAEKLKQFQYGKRRGKSKPQQGAFEL